MTNFWLRMTIFEQVLFCLLILLFLYQCYLYLRYLAAPLYRQIAAHHRAKRQGAQPAAGGEQPAASVIVCARNEGENLERFLPQLLQQDYPQFEVIVVNDGSEDNTDEVLARMALQYPNLNHTFVPKQARLRSSKKLALTLGAKAAQYEYLVLTDADCYPASKHWLSHIMQSFTPETEIVLGYGAYEKEKRFVNPIIQYDTLFNGLQYLGMAMAHHPYMGVGRNLAYRKSTFFDNHGFAGLLSTRAGDDDLFVNKVATRTNTAVVVDKESLTVSIPKHTLHEWLIQKERHLGVSPQYKTATKARLTFEPLTRALFYADAILLFVLSAQPVLWIVAASLLGARWLLQMWIINHAAYLWHIPVGENKESRWAKHPHFYALSIPLLDIFLPLNHLFLLCRYALRKRFRKVELW